MAVDDVFRAAFDDALRVLTSGAGAVGAQAPLLVGFSGGVDSTVLLHACVDALGAAAVQALHVDHGLQAGSAQWAEHCALEAGRLGVRLHTAALAPPARMREGTEAWARGGRRAALESAARSLGACAIALAHHQDDQLETVLLNLGRGAGVRGAAGMSMLDRGAGPWWWRPLLGVPRAAIEGRARALGLRWIEDPSNGDRTLRRNALRHELLPLLERTWPSARKRMLRHAAHCREADDLIHQLLGGGGGGGNEGSDAHDAGRCGPSYDGRRDGGAADGRSGRAVWRRGDGAADSGKGPWSEADPAWPDLDRRPLRDAPAGVQRGRLRQWLAAHGMRAPSEAATREMRRQLLEADGAYAEVRHDGRVIRRYRDRIGIVAPTAGVPCITAAAGVNRLAAAPPGGTRGPAAPAAAAAGTAAPIVWRWQGETRIELPGYGGALVIALAPPGRGLARARLAAAPLEIRPLRMSARLRPRAGGPSRTLKGLCQEQGVDAWQRRRLPMIVDAHGRVVFAAGFGIDAEWRARPGEAALELHFERL